MDTFKLDLQEFRFQLEVKLDEKDEAGQHRTRIDTYIIRELDGLQREDHSAKVQENLKTDGDRVLGFKNIRGTSVGLLQKCIRRLDLDTDNNVIKEHYVDEDVLVRWPSSLTAKLSFEARRLNDMMTEDDKKELKARGEQTPEQKAKNA